MAESEVAANQQVNDEQHRERLERDHKGRVVLMRSGELIDIYDNDLDAMNAGQERFGESRWSIVEIAREPAYCPYNRVIV